MFDKAGAQHSVDLGQMVFKPFIDVLGELWSWTPFAHFPSWVFLIIGLVIAGIYGYWYYTHFIK